MTSRCSGSAQSTGTAHRGNEGRTLVEDRAKEAPKKVMRKNESGCALADDARGELYLGGFTAAGSKFVEGRRIAAICNTAAGLEKMYPSWARGLEYVRAWARDSFVRSGVFFGATQKKTTKKKKKKKGILVSQRLLAHSFAAYSKLNVESFRCEW